MTDTRDICERALFLASGQDDPHSQTIIELCAEIERLRALESAVHECRKDYADLLAACGVATIADVPDKLAELEAQRNAAWRALAWAEVAGCEMSIEDGHEWARQGVSHIAAIVAARAFVAAEQASKEGK